MSWHAHFASRSDFDADEATSQSSGGMNAEQYGVARRAARLILDSGAVGDDQKPMSVTLTGHANAGHEPTGHSATDGITVTVTQATPR